MEEDELGSKTKGRKLSELCHVNVAALIAENANYLQALIIKVKDYMKNWP